ncbi:hypothetical protein ESCAB7627_2631 [Escherichia albertii TW07627]|uniref:Uncharacterized protein n=1 Tax=Escherichia albertii (strain TW07627) TaxID=502347 RepID=A0ABC9NNT3_ESCAT|nr:hypothetical protein ESCAB7627_2631 [Escherichia albertii TW07627]
MWRMSPFDGDPDTNHWKLFNKIIQKQEENPLDPSLKSTACNGCFCIRWTKYINFSIVAKTI